MTYQETVKYLFDRLPMYQRIGAAAFKKDLTNTLALSAINGDPHRRYPTIHIAGTNGKGSVSHILAAVLQAAGYKTGLYISPHYKDFRERIKVNGKYISEEAVVRYVDTMIPHIAAIAPSFFEITVAMAFDYFAEEQVDVAVIETGLGGRLDSTNIISPQLSVITNIGYDHMDMLGDTLPLIAGEKAGIIKPNTPVVIGETQPETQPVFEKVASQHAAPFLFADQHYTVSALQSSLDGMEVHVLKDGLNRYQALQTDLLGHYQLKNLATAFAVIDQLISVGWNLGDEAVARGLGSVHSSTSFMGRCQVLGKAPYILADSAHNQDGLRELMVIVGQASYRQLHFVFGTVKDKDLSKTLPLLPPAAKYYFCCPDIPRGLDAKSLQAIASDYGLQGESYESCEKAFSAARQSAAIEDMVLVAGSIFVVGEII
ncbi:MAG: folylpolyglutamate synthase/dihydrofolate synthase family protein [Chitinophagales bacterium]|nr:folylpolyglutamate synthase/dihydrofolate synthase family protein [Chitinophagales bacterium]